MKKKKEYMNATFIPEAARMCKSPEFTKDCLMSFGGDTASSPKTIPPNISRLGEFRYFEWTFNILSR